MRISRVVKSVTGPQASAPEPLRLAIAGGGTGGHIFPAVAVAEALESVCALEVLWIGTGRHLEKKIIPVSRWDYRVLDVKPLLGKRPIEVLKSMLSLPVAVAKARRWLSAFSPHVVLGVGGYVSGPVILAARLLSLPAALHEQNLAPGLANRLASWFSSVVFTSFEETKAFFPDKKVKLTGNPVRTSVLLSASRIRRAPAGPRKLLIMGGSQGATGLNQLVSSAILELHSRGCPLEVVHQSGPADVRSLKDLYEAAGVDAEVHEFISDIGRRYAEADLVVCRAGAGAIAELTALGKPSVLIPYPFSAADHQDDNARELWRSGAALVFKEKEIAPDVLAAELGALLENRERLGIMAVKAAELGRTDAATAIATELVSLANYQVPVADSRLRITSYGSCTKNSISIL